MEYIFCISWPLCLAENAVCLIFKIMSWHQLHHYFQWGKAVASALFILFLSFQQQSSAGYQWPVLFCIHASWTATTQILLVSLSLHSSFKISTQTQFYRFYGKQLQINKHFVLYILGTGWMKQLSWEHLCCLLKTGFFTLYC